jgi:hypothetical protein
MLGLLTAASSLCADYELREKLKIKLRVSQRARYRFLLLHQESLSRVLGAHHPNLVA